MAASNGSEYFEFETYSGREAFSARPSNAESLEEDEGELLWAAIAKLPSQRRTNIALLRRSQSELNRGGKAETIDVTKLDRYSRELLVKKALDTTEQDNFKLLSAIKERLDRVGLEVPKVEVRFENLNVSADVQSGSRALPTLFNSARDVIEYVVRTLRIFRPKRQSLTILNNVSGTLRPGRVQ